MKKKDERLYNHNFIEACNNAVNGIVYSATTQSNIKKQLVIGVIVMILSLFYNFTTAEFLCLTFRLIKYFRVWGLYGIYQESANIQVRK